MKRPQPIPKASRPQFEPADRTCPQCRKTFTPPGVGKGHVLGAKLFCSVECTWAWRDKHRGARNRYVVPGLEIPDPERPQCSVCGVALPEPGMCPACVILAAVDKQMRSEVLTRYRRKRKQERLAAHRLLTQPDGPLPIED